MMKKTMQSLWPGFLGACGLELFVFAALDPKFFRIFNTWELTSPGSVYTLSFFIFWAACAGAAFIALSLSEKQAPHPIGPAP